MIRAIVGGCYPSGVVTYGRRSISSVARRSLSEKWKISENVLDIISAPSERSVHRFLEPRALFLASRLTHRVTSDPLGGLTAYFTSHQGAIGHKDPPWMKGTLSNEDPPAIPFGRLVQAIQDKSVNGFHINKRMEYFYSILRVFNDNRSLDLNLPPDPNLRFGYFVKVLTSGIRMDEIPRGEFYSHLEKEIATHARFYDADYHSESIQSQFDLKVFPKWMCLGNMNEFKDKLKVSFQEPGILEELVSAYEPLCHWNRGHFSEALTLMASNTDTFFRSLDSEQDVKDLIRRQGLPLISSLQVMIKDLKEGNMESASEYYRLISDDLHQKHGIPLLQYLMEGSSDESLRQPSFDGHFHTDNVMSLKVLREIEDIAPDFLFYFLKTVQARRASERSRAMSSSLKSPPPEFEDSAETLQLMGKALRDLTDLQILEYLNNNELTLAVDSIVLEKEESLPSREVCLLLVKAMKEEPKLLKRLREFLPPRHYLRDVILEIENVYFLSKLRSKWQSSEEKRSEYMMALLKYLVAFVEANKNTMHDEANYIRLTNDMIKHVRFFCDSLFTDHGESLDVEEANQVFACVQSFGSLLHNTSQDARLMIACWEGLFFSGEPGFRRLNEELIAGNSWVPTHLKIGDLIDRIQRLEDTELMSRLVDICQTHDLEDSRNAVLAEEAMIDKHRSLFSRRGLFSLFRKKFLNKKSH